MLISVRYKNIKMATEIIIIIVIISVLLLKFIVYVLNKHRTQTEKVYP
jgi:competence protein ComGC